VKFTPFYAVALLMPEAFMQSCDHPSGRFHLLDETLSYLQEQENVFKLTGLLFVNTVTGLLKGEENLLYDFCTAKRVNSIPPIIGTGPS
jgi:hypothetical protein